MPLLWRGVAMAAAVVSTSPLTSCQLLQENFGQIDYQARYEQALAVSKIPEPLDAEAVLYQQSGLLEARLDKLAGERPGATDLYFVAFGGYGGQNVFTREVLYAEQLFRERFQAAGRTVPLVNNRALIEHLPLASVTNLRETLWAVAGRMNPEEDILFLFLTSHGSQDHVLAVELDGLPLQSLPAETLAQLLRETPVKWKVIVISACYSGGFIKPLKDPYSLIIAAARPDRNSFGCSNDADLTYFGRAFFERALNQTASFVDAFYRARMLVAQWEEAQDYTPSEPQIASSPLIEAKLAEWRATLDGPGAAASRPHEDF